VSATTLCLIAGGLCSAVAAALAFAAAVRAGHLDDLEETKFRMFREDERR
jgi:hypothetical protein